MERPNLSQILTPRSPVRPKWSVPEMYCVSFCNELQKARTRTKAMNSLAKVEPWTKASDDAGPQEGKVGTQQQDRGELSRQLGSHSIHCGTGERCRVDREARRGLKGQSGPE